VILKELGAKRNWLTVNRQSWSNSDSMLSHPRAEVASNISTVFLRVVGGDEKGTQCLGYNWAALFLGYLNTGTWLSRFGDSRTWGRKIWSRVPWDWNPRMTALARTSSDCKWQTRPLDREGAPYQQMHICPTLIKIWSWVSSRCLTSRHTVRLTVRYNITSTFSSLSPLGGVERVGWWVTESVKELLRFSCSEELLWETGSWGREYFGNSE
jgi:hypothetical protein